MMEKWRVMSNWWLVALNLPKAQLDLGMPVELWSVDSRSVAERAPDSVGLQNPVCDHIRSLGLGFCTTAEKWRWLRKLKFRMHKNKY
jgi:hypothetical protein